MVAMTCSLLFVAFLCANFGVGFHVGVTLPPGARNISACTGVLLSGEPANGTQELMVPAFFPFGEGHEEVDNGHYLIPSALLALDEINANPWLLPGYHLRLDLRDSECDRYTAVYELSQSVQDASRSEPPTPVVAVLGGACSAVSAGLGLLIPLYRLPQISYGINPASTDGRGDPLPFFQLVDSLNQTFRTSLGVLQHFDWISNVALVFQDSEVHTRVLESAVTSNHGGNFTASIENPTITVNLVLFHRAIVNPTSNLALFFRRVRSKNVRIILAVVNENLALSLLCKAQSSEMPATGFVWVFVGSFSSNWWNRNTCNLTAKDVESILIVSSQTKNLNSSAVLPSGRTVSEFEAQYKMKLEAWCPGAQEELLHTTVYDAMWTIALAVNATLDSTEALSYPSNSLTLYDNITSALSESNFIGSSGEVRFDETRGRTGFDAIRQIQDGNAQLIGYFDKGQFSFDVEEYSMVWRDGKLPTDVPIETVESVSMWLTAPIVVVTTIGIAFSISMFIFNWKYRKHRILLAASGRLNYVILVGTLMSYTSILLLCLLESELGRGLSDEVFGAICVIRLAGLSMSFTLAYGTMFVRAWRIYRIFNNPWTATRPLQDYRLMLMVTGLLVGDLIILACWNGLDTYRRFTSVSDDYESYTRCTYYSCGSTYLIVWLGIVGLYKALLMLGGVFVVSLVRKAVIKKKIFDDSKSLSLALYTTAISFSIGLPLQALFLLQFQIVLAFVVSVVWVTISTYSTIVCVFIPKFYSIVIKKDSGRKITSLQKVFRTAHPELKHCPISETTVNRCSPDFATIDTITIDGRSTPDRIDSHSVLVRNERNGVDTA